MTTHDKKPIEVRPAGPGSGWVVAREGDPDEISRHPTQLAAIKEGKPLARREATDFVVKGRDGHVRARSSYRGAHPPDRRRRHFVPDLDREPFETRFPPATSVALAAPLLDRIDAALARAQRANCFIALLVMGEIEAESSDPSDVDLMEVAQALESVMRPGDTVVRGPDDSTLLVICNTISCAADGEMIADRLVSKAGVVCRIQSTFSGGERDAEALLTRAIRRWTTDQERRRAERQPVDASDRR
jgi:Uncharacterized protein conserved in bacteria (DUF2188)